MSALNDEPAGVPVQTVLGPVPSSTLGMTLMHEHLICDWTSRMVPPADVDDRALWERPVGPSDTWLLVDDPAARVDNGRLDDATTAAEELLNFVATGGRTVVECTNDDVGRDPLLLRSIAERSGVNIVMGSGWYVEAFHRSETLALSADELCEQLVAEFTGGVGESGIVPGIIGEVGVSPSFTAAESTRLRAACRAQLQVDVPLLIHLPGWQRRGLEVLEVVLDEEGVPSSSVVLCHMDPSGDDVSYQRAVADRGVWLEFDMVGMPTYYAGEGQSPAPAQTAEAVAGLIRDGFSDQILVSHDMSVKSMWTRNGGNGLGYVPRSFLPRLERSGVAHDIAAALLSDNPRRLFEAAAR